MLFDKLKEEDVHLDDFSQLSYSVNYNKGVYEQDFLNY